ncbi:type I-F CRISPR-associated protein Csy1, partial [Vibrio parahaemolyticus]
KEIYGLTTIGYGGTKPQNISVLNNQNAGKAHLLPSLPPQIAQRKRRLPTYDFFTNTVNPWQVKETLEAFHGLISLP